MIAPIDPITSANTGDGIKGSAVIATKPASAPLSIITISVFPPSNLVKTAPVTVPAAPARCVLTAIVVIAFTSSKVPIANWLKPLNPNQPNHNKNVPSVTSGILDAANGTKDFFSPFFPNLPSRAPKTITPASAAAPPHA